MASITDTRIFRKEDGSSRILAIWDQSIAGNPPAGFRLGTEYDRNIINDALQQENIQEGYRICPSRDLSGHGTHVAGIAAGNGRASNERNRGVAYESDLLVVKLGTPGKNSFPKDNRADAWNGLYSPESTGT